MRVHFLLAIELIFTYGLSLLLTVWEPSAEQTKPIPESCRQAEPRAENKKQTQFPAGGEP